MEIGHWYITDGINEQACLKDARNGDIIHYHLKCLDCTNTCKIIDKEVKNDIHS